MKRFLDNIRRKPSSKQGTGNASIGSLSDSLDISDSDRSSLEASSQIQGEDTSESSLAESGIGFNTPSKSLSRAGSALSISRSDSQASSSVSSSRKTIKLPSKIELVPRIFQKVLMAEFKEELEELARPLYKFYEALKSAISPQESNIRYTALQKASSALSINAEEIQALLANFTPERTVDVTTCQLAIQILNAIRVEIKQLDENQEKEVLQSRYNVLSLFVIEKFHFSRNQGKLIADLNNIFNSLLSESIYLTLLGLIFPSSAEAVNQFGIFFKLLRIGQIKEDHILVSHREIKEFLQILGYPEKKLDDAIANLYQHYSQEEISGERKYHWACFDEALLIDSLILKHYFEFLVAEVRKIESRSESDSELQQILTRIPKPERLDVQPLNEGCYRLFVWLERISLVSGEANKKFLSFSTFLPQRKPSLLNEFLDSYDINNKNRISEKIGILINNLFSDLYSLFFPANELPWMPISLNKIGLNISVEYEIAQKFTEILSFRRISSSYVQSKLVVPHHAISELFYLAHFPQNIIGQITEVWYISNRMEFNSENSESLTLTSLFENLSLPFCSFKITRQGLEIYIKYCFEIFNARLREKGIKASYLDESVLVPHHYIEKFFRQGNQPRETIPSYLRTIYERRGMEFNDEVFKSIVIYDKDEGVVNNQDLKSSITAISYDNGNSYIIQLKLESTESFNENTALFGLGGESILLTKRLPLALDQKKCCTYFFAPSISLTSEITVVCQVGEKISLQTIDWQKALQISEREKNSIWMSFFEEQFAKMNTLKGQEKMAFGIKLRMQIGDSNDPITKFLRGKVDAFLDAVEIESDFSQWFIFENIYFILNEILLRRLPHIGYKGRDEVAFDLNNFNPNSLTYYIYFDFSTEQFKFKLSELYFYRDKFFEQMEQLSPGCWIAEKGILATSDPNAVEKFFNKHLKQDHVLATEKSHYGNYHLDFLQRFLMTTLSEWLGVPPIQWSRARLGFNKGKISFYFSPALKFSCLEEFEAYLEKKSFKLPRSIRKLLGNIQLSAFETSIQVINANIKNWIWKQYSVESQRLIVKIFFGQSLRGLNLPLDEYFYMAVIDYLKSLWRLFSKKLEFNVVDEKIIISPKPFQCLEEEEIACFMLPEAMKKELNSFFPPQEIKDEELARIEYFDEVSYVAMRIATQTNLPGKLSSLEARLGKNLPKIALAPDFGSLGYRWIIRFESKEYARSLKEKLSLEGDGATLFLNYEQMDVLLRSLGISPEKIKGFYAQFDFYPPSEVETRALLEGIDFKDVYMDAHMLRSVKKVFKELYTFFPYVSLAEGTVDFSRFFNAIMQRNKLSEIQQLSHRRLSAEAKLVLLNMTKLLFAEGKAKYQETQLSLVFNTLFQRVSELAAKYPHSVRVEKIASLLKDKPGKDNSICSKLMRFRNGIYAPEIKENESIFSGIQTFFSSLNIPFQSMDLEIDYFLSVSLTAIEEAERQINSYRP